jgi:GMP synthase (glutamine-hydrolysing)
MRETLRYMLLQVRNPGDPMAPHEVACFARALACRPEQIEIFDLLRACPTVRDLARVDVVLLGGSGDYSVAEGGPWMEPALEAMRELSDLSKPTFASCWGFQAMAAALGGAVVTDLGRAEVGTIETRLTRAGRADPVFGALGDPFLAQMGHQDIVDSLPPGAVLLASTPRVENEAFCLDGKPIYCTQFHPELDRAAMIARVQRYPFYVERILGVPADEFIRDRLAETPGTSSLLSRFIAHFFG